MQLMVVENDDKQIFARRLNELLDEADFPKRNRVRQFHEQVKDLWPPDRISYEAVRKWLSGESIPNTRRLTALAKLLGVEPYDLLPGSEPRRRSITRTDDAEFFTIGPNGGPVAQEDDQFEYVQAYKVQAAAGAGKDVYTEQPNGTRAFSRQWLQERGFRPKDLVMIEANGDSMSPYINDGDAILVDQSRRNIVNGQVYVFRIDHDLRVKRLYKNVNGTITVTSDNKSDPSYREEQLRPEDLEGVNILGMVVWRAG